MDEVSSLYSSLFRYRAGEGREPLEDFLTEALAHLLNVFLDQPRGSQYRQSAEQFIYDRLCGSNSTAPKRSALSAARVRFETQVRIELPMNGGLASGRLDLCMYLDWRLLLVVENKVRAAPDGKAASLDESDRRHLAGQLGFYSRWLKANHPDAGLTLLSVGAPPSGFFGPDFDGRGYPARFTAFCSWHEVFDWLGRTPKTAVLANLVDGFRSFLEEKSMGDIGKRELDLLRGRLPPVREFTEALGETVREILLMVRKTAKTFVPKHGYRPEEVELPAVVRGFEDEGKNTLGDFVFAYKDDLILKDLWFAGWGFQVTREGVLQAFICVESEFSGPEVPRPEETLRSKLGKSWHFPFVANERGERAAVFEKVVDPATFLREGFTKASSRWFVEGVREAAAILKAGRQALLKQKRS